MLLYGRNFFPVNMIPRSQVTTLNNTLLLWNSSSTRIWIKNFLRKTFPMIRDAAKQHNSVCECNGSCVKAWVFFLTIRSSSECCQWFRSLIVILIDLLFIVRNFFNACVANPSRFAAPHGCSCYKNYSFYAYNFRTLWRIRNADVLDIIAGFTTFRVLRTPISDCLASRYQSTAKSKAWDSVKDGLPLKEKSTIFQVSPQHRIRVFV